MDIKHLITKDPETLGGTPVFTGTRVPVESLFDHLEAGVSLDEFLGDFPIVTRDQAIAVLEIASKNIAVFVLSGPNNTFDEMSKLVPKIEAFPESPVLPSGIIEIK